VVACVRHTANGTVRREVRTFKTTTQELLALSEWLSGEGCTDIAMEATRRLLEAGVARPERRRFRPAAGERGARQKRAGTQD
jgi:hypothetical protein